MQAHELKPPRGSKRKRKRVGRGDGSGYGTTAGRGTKGQRSRSGGRTRPFFEGGQMPLFRRLPKRGFKPFRRTRYAVVNLHGLEQAFEQGSAVGPSELYQAQLISREKSLVKILGTGDLTKPLIVRAHKFSASAAAAIESAGGKAEVIL